MSSLTSTEPARDGGPYLVELPTCNRPLSPVLPAMVVTPSRASAPGASVRLFTQCDPPLVGHLALRQQL